MDRLEFEKWYLVEVARITIRIKVRIILTPFPIWNLVLSFSLSACLEPQKPRLIPRNSLNHYYSSRENKELPNPFATSGTGLQCTGYSSFSALYHFLFARRLFLSSIGDWRHELDKKNLGFFSPLLWLCRWLRVAFFSAQTEQPPTLPQCPQYAHNIK